MSSGDAISLEVAGDDSDRPVDFVRRLRGAGPRHRNRWRGGADLIHVDVMDGHFVPTSRLDRLSSEPFDGPKRPLDVHLMIEEPDRYIEDFVKSGASMVWSTSRRCLT